MNLAPDLWRGLLAARRALRLSLGTLAALVFAVVVASGRLGGDLRGDTPRALELLAVAALGVLLIGKLAARLRFAPPPARLARAAWEARALPVFIELETGLVLVVATWGVLELTGGLRSPLLPLIYALVAFVVTFSRRWLGALLALAAVALEAAVVWRLGRPAWALRSLATHAGFAAFFAVLHLAFVHGEIWRMRRESSARILAEIRAMREEARDFRLISTALGQGSRPVRSREDEETKLYQGAVETIHQSLFYTLELVKQTLELNTCVLLWLDASGERLKIKELVTDSDAVTELPISADAGALGAIVRERVLVNLRTPKRGHVAYYAGPAEIGAFLGVPVLEDGQLRGVLCADRASGRPFETRDEQVLAGAATQILRAIQSERVFAAVEKGKYEHERFYRASELLRSCLTPDQVFDTTFQAVAEIAAFDAAAITLFDKVEKQHSIVRAAGEAKALEGQVFGDNAGLCAMVVKNKHYLPASGELRDRDTPIYTKRLRLKGAESLLVLPLIRGGEAIGTLMIASARRTVFTKDVRDMLGVIANQVAASLDNAQMYRRMEEMATTDGLTGLTNHRTFQERFSQLIERSARHGKKCTLILTDIDHFKKVNDTFGHPMGDQVLKRIAKVLEANVRKIDIVARYGGEEFALVLEETDAEGALKLAERIRMDAAAQSFTKDGGPATVTLSLGIACFPDDAQDKVAMIAASDKCLYAAKHAGRNRAVLASSLDGAAQASKARALKAG